MRTQYNLLLNANPSLRLRWFVPLIKAAEKWGRVYQEKYIVLSVTDSGSGSSYTLSITAEVEVTDTILLTLRWKDEGAQQTQTIWILKEESHLISGSYVYFFFCDGYKSKNLYYICSKWKSRRDFPHRYYDQIITRRRRQLRPKESPYKDYGKEYYRGKITPYGKRCKKYDAREYKFAQIMYDMFVSGIHKKAERRRTKK